MCSFLKYFVLLFNVMFSALLSAESTAPLLVEVTQGHVRETIPGTEISSAYMTIHNNSAEALVLEGVISDVSSRLELHQHSMVDGMMKMRQVETITIPAKGELILQPSGYHIMIFSLQNGLQAGSEVKMTLLFSQQRSLDIFLPVQSIKQQHNHSHH